MNEPISYLKSFNHNDKSFQKNAVDKINIIFTKSTYKKVFILKDS